MTKPFCFVKFVVDNIVSDVKVQTEYFMEKEEIRKYIPFFFNILQFNVPLYISKKTTYNGFHTTHRLVR